MFCYGDFVADQVKTAKLKKNKEFNDADYKRISALVTKTVAAHQEEYYKSEEIRLKEEYEAKELKEKERQA